MTCLRFPQQRLTREEALKGVSPCSSLVRGTLAAETPRPFSGMTLDPAWASFSEDSLGSLTPGKRADFVVLSKDVMTIPESGILSTKVLATAIDGRPVYGHI